MRPHELGQPVHEAARAPADCTLRVVRWKAAALQLDAAEASSFGAFADSVRAVLGEQFGRTQFDFLVNNAGVGVHAPFAETTETQLDQL